MDYSVVTLNTWKCDGLYRERLRLMADGLRALSPDLVMLQEAFATEDCDEPVDTARVLAEATGMHVVHHPGRRKERLFETRTVVSTSGLAILSRRPILRHEVIDLPTDPRDGERHALIAVIAGDSPERPVVAVTTHLSHLARADALRQAQMDAALDAVSALPETPAVVFLGGDLNSSADSDLVTTLGHRHGLEVTNAYHVGDLDVSFPTLVSGLPKRAATRDKCIDFIFMLTAAHAAPSYRLVTTERVLDKPDPETSTYPSDHTGVRAVFRRVA
ncbi:endonuclease/exonuclease/phosphatase family protein [Caenispirillum bisanense]|uniref:endonuclease/exonuclease/phosphatase family protein n=1 Tax=Caenispirillum bisanense TaxID=414052 RepID=UPI0031E026F7